MARKTKLEDEDLLLQKAFPCGTRVSAKVHYAPRGRFSLHVELQDDPEFDTTDDFYIWPEDIPFLKQFLSEVEEVFDRCVPEED